MHLRVSSSNRFCSSGSLCLWAFHSVEEQLCRHSGTNATMTMFKSWMFVTPGGVFSMKMPYQHNKSHYKDKTVSWRSYFYKLERRSFYYNGRLNVYALVYGPRVVADICHVKWCVLKDICFVNGSKYIARTEELVPIIGTQFQQASKPQYKAFRLNLAHWRSQPANSAKNASQWARYS